MTFASPWVLLLLVAVPLVAWWCGRAKRRPALVYSSVDLLSGLRPTARQRLAWIPGALSTLSAAALIIALARPQTGIGEVRTSAKGVAIAIVLDRSASMQLALNFAGARMTRIDVVKRVIREFVLGNERDLNGRPEDMIGLVTFGRFPETVCPLVRIHGTLVKLVDSIVLASEQWEGGTAIGDGLSLGAARLKQAADDLEAEKRKGGERDFTLKSKIIVLLTDGDENAGDTAAPDAARLCKEWGIKIYVIGIGDERGGVVVAGGQRTAVMPGAGFDEELMRNLATTTGGAYWRATTGESLREAYAKIDELEKTEIESTEFTNYEERYFSFAVAAGSLLGLAMLLKCTLLGRSP